MHQTRRTQVPDFVLESLAAVVDKYLELTDAIYARKDLVDALDVTQYLINETERLQNSLRQATKED